MPSSAPAPRAQPVLWLLGVLLLAGLAVGGVYPCRLLWGQAAGQPAAQAVGGAQLDGAGNDSSAAADAITATTPLLQPLPVVRADERPGRVAFYFSGEQVQLPADANKALGEVIRGVAVGRGVAIRGHAAVGTPAALTTQRVLAVHNLLVSLGIGEDKIRRLRPGVLPAEAPAAKALAQDHVDVVLDGSPDAP